MKDSKNILVVEDDLTLLQAIRLKLEKSDFKVYHARSVTEAFDQLKQTGDIDAIWLDHYLLGSKNGYQFAAECKKHKSKFRHIPIFVISNTAGSDKIHSYLKLGVEKYYVKAEIRLDEVVQEIIETLENNKTALA